MKIYVTRDSVAAGDDIHAPHTMTIKGPPGQNVEAAIAAALANRYLPRIEGGRATWSVASNKLVAVVAQQWRKPRLLGAISQDSYDGLDTEGGVLRLHFSYHAQQDPDVVFEVLDRVRLKVNCCQTP